ncbi:hypothetical protein BDW42DRAFT_168658 [Aspergillus taichungensis]|uniref:Uncharacterized protein n=1 Tax=Aspergillus taichungensis TaxID=482145 RepID=A0A2J5HWF8_9EURO|nr:hypothetical protein BDW42DRAFT_168658 [Aspergillus taichungensis]
MAQCALRLFRGQGPSTLRPSISGFIQKRTRATIPTFTQTSSPELDQELHRFREELFIPYGLPQGPRRMMFRQKYADRLDEEQITVPLEGEEEDFTLRPMDPQTRPTNQEAVAVLRMMQTKQDWNNLAPFLRGLKIAGRKLSPERQEWLARRAGNADALGIVLDCARQAEKTGLYLNNPLFVEQIFLSLHKKALLAEFKGPELTKAAELATQFVSLMDSPEHHQASPSLDPRKRPLVSAVLLELNAARAVEEHNRHDQDGLVRLYAERLFGTWVYAQFSKPEYKDWYEIDRLLQRNVAVYNAMNLAQQVQEVGRTRDVGRLLKTRSNDLKMIIQKQRSLAPAEIQQKPTLGYVQSTNIV